MERFLLLSIVGVLAIGGTGAAVAATSSSPATSICGSAEPSSQAVSHRPSAATSLVPAAPTSVVICRYNGLPEPGKQIAGFMLIGEQTLSDTQVTALASAFDALKATYAPGKAYSCPLDSGSEAVLHFSYASGDNVTVTVHLSGCTSSTNGAPTYINGPATGPRTVYRGYPSSLRKLALGSKSFIRAHETLLDGTGPSATVQVNAKNGDWTAEATIRKGKFSVYVTPGSDEVMLIRSGVTQETRSIRAPAGGTAHVRL
jgi:hypothetical protein